MSITITPRKERPTTSIYNMDVPITSQVPLGYGAYFKIIGPVEAGTILDGSVPYKEFLADENPQKYCIIYDELYIGMDTRMKLDIHIFNGQGYVENREAAVEQHNMRIESGKNKISKFSITDADWKKLVNSGQLVKLA